MAATRPVAMEPLLGTTLPSDATWRWQVKWDGIRCLAVVDTSGVVLWSRRGRIMTAAFPDVVARLRHALIPSQATLDGELIVLDKSGRPSFPQVLGRLLRDGGAPEPPAVYAVFDLLELEGRSLRPQPLGARLAQLDQALRPQTGIHLVQTRSDGGPAMLEAVAALGLEGIVAKRADAPYIPGPSRHWLKFKLRRQLQAQVGGWRPHAVGGLRALCLVQGRGDGWAYLGDVASGMKTGHAADWLAALLRLPPWSPPFARPPGRCWVQPRHPVTVSYAEFTAAGHLRAPALIAAPPPPSVP